MSSAITYDDIVAARKRIAAHIQPLRVTRSESLSSRFGGDIMLAHEYLQTTGAFKLRGAMNAVLQLPPGASGVTAVSTGNHGRALAYSARQAGVPCIICMSELVPPNKIEGIRALGAETRIIGNAQPVASRCDCRRNFSGPAAADRSAGSFTQPGPDNAATGGGPETFPGSCRL